MKKVPLNSGPPRPRSITRSPGELMGKDREGDVWRSGGQSRRVSAAAHPLRGMPALRRGQSEAASHGRLLVPPALYPVVPRIMQWMRCGDCEHVFTDGYFLPDVMATVFARTHDHQKTGHGFEQQRFISARMVEKVARHATLGAWLDVGFGNASLLFTAQEWGFVPIGLDLRSANVETLQKMGIEAHCRDLASLDGEARLAVTAWPMSSSTCRSRARG
jgi:hypothetical protein